MKSVDSKIQLTNSQTHQILHHSELFRVTIRGLQLGGLKILGSFLGSTKKIIDITETCDDVDKPLEQHESLTDVPVVHVLEQHGLLLRVIIL